MLEAHLTKLCGNYFKELKRKHEGFFYQKISDRYTSGIPDYYILFNGNTLWLELKKTGAKARPLQEYTLKQLRRAGAQTLVTDDFETVKRAVFSLVLHV